MKGRKKHPDATGGTIRFAVKVPRGRGHRVVWLEATKGYKWNCGYGFYIGNTFYKDLKLFGFKKLPSVVNELRRFG